jgi:hypothetical protein
MRRVLGRIYYSEAERVGGERKEGGVRVGIFAG